MEHLKELTTTELKSMDKYEKRSYVLDTISNMSLSKEVLEYNHKDIVHTTVYGTDDEVKELFVTLTLYALQQTTVLPGSRRSIRLLKFLLYVRKFGTMDIKKDEKLSVLDGLLAD